MSGYNGNPIQQISSALSNRWSNPGSYSVGPTTQFNFPQSLKDNVNAAVKKAQTEIRGITPTIPSGSNTGSAMGYVGKAVDLIGGFMPERDEYQGTYGDITQTMDSVYDATADALMAIPGWGCVCAGTRVIDNQGRFVNIEDLKQEDGIIGWNNGQINKEKIIAFIDPHEKECLEIKLQSGNIIRCSIDHPILCSKGWSKEIKIEGKRKNIKVYKFIRADNIKVGDNLGIANEINIWGSFQMENPYLIGMLIGDGSYGKDHGARLYSTDLDTWNYIEKNQLGGKINYDCSRYSSEFRCYRIYNGAQQLKALGIYEQTGQNKTLPKDIYKYDKESVCDLLAGLFDTDGCIFYSEEKGEYKIFLAQSNLNLLKEVSEQLLKLGIHSSIQVSKEKTSIISNRIINSKKSYRLVIKDKHSIINFYNNIKLNISYKKQNLEKLYIYIQNIYSKDNRYVAGAKADKVVEINNIGLQIIYNLQADDDHTYLANGIITHNTIAGGAMKVAGVLGDAVGSLGGSTDGMTKVDSILGSSFFNLTPFGLINGFGGKTTDTITKDEQSFEQVGASYGGTSATVDDALTKSGKKYGLFSMGAMNDANQEIAEAKRQQAIMGNISDIATDRRAISQSMAAINGNRRAYQLQGGYQQQNIRVGKHGMNIDLINRAKQILSYTEIEPISPQLLSKFKDGGQINKKSRTLQELIEYAKKENPRFIQRLSEPPRGIDFIDDEGNQARGSHYMEWSTDNNGNAIIYPRIQEVGEELKFFSGPDAYKRAVENKNYLIMTPEEAKLFFAEDSKYGIAYKSGWPQFFDKFQQGGSINVIPYGALHARKHNMDMDGITKKGIPVVTETEDGQIEQQAEIEKEEIIMRLEVTQKLEKLAKEGTDEAALEAGKLLVEEILYNTDDKANLINRV